MKLNIIHGIFIGITTGSMAIHLSVYLGCCNSYYRCTTSYWLMGTWGYLIYWLTPKLISFVKKNLPKRR